MIKSAVTISLVPEARGGPFVFWDDLEEGCRKAKEYGFDAIELFAPDAATIKRGDLRRLLNDLGLKLAAAGTGAGYVKHKLTLSSPDPAVRRGAREFVRSIMEAAGELGAPAIVGSMQGRWGEAVAHADAVGYLRDALQELGERASGEVSLLFEPLNRYETNLFNRLHEAAQVLPARGTVKLLADLFHMNIEEGNIEAAFREVAGRVGHVHFADSNRRPVGLGHVDMPAVARVLHDIGYDGYVSAEALPFPYPDAAARQTMLAFRKYFRPGHA